MKKTVLTILVGIVGTMSVLAAIIGIMYVMDDEDNNNTYQSNSTMKPEMSSNNNSDNRDDTNNVTSSEQIDEDNKVDKEDNYTSDNNVTLYLFHGSTCQFCLRAKEYLRTIKDDYDYLTIKTIEVWGNSANQELLKKVREELGDNIKDGVPYMVISNEYHSTGYSSSKDEAISEGITKAHKQDNYQDVVQKIIEENKDLEVVVEDFQ